MAIVLNEKEWAEEMINARSLGKKPTETLRRVARYHLDNGLPKREVRAKIELFLLQCDPTASVPKWSNALDRAVQMAMKYPAVNIDSITITKPEMARIDALEGKQLRRLAFTLLCLSKYWNIVTRSGNGWVNSRDNEIMRMANINTSIRRQSTMYFNLAEAGMIRFSRKVDNTNVQVCFQEDGEPAMQVTTFVNLGYQYMMAHGEPYFVCESCGVTTRIESPNRGRRQKYCRACAAKIDIQYAVNSVMRKRGKAARTAPN